MQIWFLRLGHAGIIVCPVFVALVFTTTKKTPISKTCSPTCLTQCLVCCSSGLVFLFITVSHQLYDEKIKKNIYVATCIEQFSEISRYKSISNIRLHKREPKLNLVKLQRRHEQMGDGRDTWKKGWFPEEEVIAENLLLTQMRVP